MPRVLMRFLDVLIIHKPPGWEIEREKTGAARCLEEWFRQVVTEKVGFLHRLDTQCSGLLIVTATFESCCFFQWQLHVGALVRDYLVMCNALQ